MSAPMELHPGAPEGWAYNDSGLLVPPAFRRKGRYDRPVGIGLFAGCGGMDLGFHMGGFHMAAAVEFEPAAAITYMVNLARPGVKIHFDTPEREEKFAKALERHLGLKGAPRGGRKVATPDIGGVAGGGWISTRPPWERGCEHFWVADVRNLTGEQILDQLGLERGEVAAVIGGPPCQGFSKAGKQDVMDPRNSFVFEFARLVLEIWPKTFVMENVPALLTMLTPEGVPVIDAFSRVIADGGFSDYNALRKSLGAQAGTRGAMRRDRAGSHADDEDEESSEEDEQLGLFDLDGAA